VTFGPFLCVAFLAVWGVAVSVADANLAAMFVVNGVLQLALFSMVAIVPLIKTGRMSFVDIAWPFGVALIGIQILLMGDGDFIRKACVAGVYLLIGLRMGIGALTMARTTGVIIRTEFPRYTYRRMELSLKGESGIRLHMGAEILAQGFANASVLAIPGFLMAVNSDGQLHLLELAGGLVWFIAYLLESTADLQKLNFISKNKGGVCNVGLWRYSRHPNYFAEWLVWTGIVIASIPSWLALQGGDVDVASAVLGIGGLGASVMMYITLVYLTGAIPSEYYSVRKRADYKRYQETTNMFFPWFPKK
jgi:steroid 5-alpha reductase family enzyme